MRKRACNQENMRLLYDALMSGDYLQCQNRLRNITFTGTEKHHGGFCCLGVACNVSGTGRWGTATDQATNPAEKYFTEGGPTRGDGYELPEAVAKWLGLRKDRNTVWTQLLFRYDRSRRSDERFITGSSLNDNGKSFADIAAMIKEVYLVD